MEKVEMVYKCEDCGREEDQIPYPGGWTACGTSKWGKAYDRKGFAMHCPPCGKSSFKKETCTVCGVTHE